MTDVSQVVPGVWRMGTDFYNWYLVEGDGGLTAVDAGVPGFARSLEDDVRKTGHSLADVRALVLTHGDADHIGIVSSFVEAGVPVHAPAGEVERMKRPGTKTGDANPKEFLKQLWTPRMLRMIVKTIPYFGRPTPVHPDATFGDGDVLDVPGRPRVIGTPGHTPGHSALLFEERGALFVGDALTTHGLLRRGGEVSLMPKFMNESNAGALAALDALDGISADVTLFGHGDPWRKGVAAAVEGGRRSASS